LSIWRLVLCEIGYRPLSFALAILSVVVAVGCLSCVLTLLRLHDLRTEQLIAAREAQVTEDMRILEDNYRKITKDLGFNLRIFHKDQDAAEFHRNHYATHYLDDQAADRLGKAGVLTVNHLLPILHEVVQWKELGQTVHVVGTRGEIPITGQARKKPLVEAVPKKQIVLGADVQKKLKVKPGDVLDLNGRSFTVKRVHASRGSDEDITVWLNLADAQELLGKKGKINVILALECNCEADRFDKVREEIVKVLPDTQVMEMSVLAEGRARARNEAKATAVAAVEQIQRDRLELRAARTALASILLPVVLLSSTVWLGGLVFTNIRDRRGEIGILRAVGVSSLRVAGLVLGRSLLIGVAGAFAGYSIGVGVGLLWAEDLESIEFAEVALDPVLTPLLLVAAPLWCGVASLMPALVAARQDPAVVLSEA
jgi:hypothetical protein